MFHVKICGITCPDDALAAAHAGADAVGLNFYSGSRRFVDHQQATAIVAALPERVAKVGVFVNARAEQVRSVAESVGLDYVQLHGDEPPQLISELTGLAVVRAFRLGTDGWRPITEFLDQCYLLGALPRAVLVDACRPGLYGGTGEATDWAIAREYHELRLGLPLILAGGLTPANVSEAVAAVEPDGVDTASGVESAPGVKDTLKVAAFVAAARAALKL